VDVSRTVGQILRGGAASTRTTKEIVRLLDIECSDDETYFCLFNGFSLLARQNKRLADESASAEPIPPVNEDITRGDAVAGFTEPDQGQGLHAAAFHSSLPETPMSAPSEPEEAETPESLFSSPSRWRWKKTPVSVGRTGNGNEPTNSPQAQLPPEFLGWRSAGTQIWARLRFAGLIVKVIYDYQLNRVALQVKSMVQTVCSRQTLS
jgi:hypothetical protein